jgi:Na+-translocating ferredoxin:NAD+ oxidoreductase subunit B
MIIRAILVSQPSVLIAIAIGGGVALLLGILIMIISKFFAIPVDERLDSIRSILPGANCGACGFSGCEGYAAALKDGEQNPSRCPVGGAEVAAELAALLGLNKPEFIPQVAHVFCQGTTQHTGKRYEYAGTIGCAAAHGLFSGPNSCTYGCIGFGDCVSVCQYDALYLADGIAHVDSSRCTACGMCVKTCPKELIKIIPKNLNAYTVKCRNKWPGAMTRKNCSIGCIGCRRCFQVCEYGAISMDGPLAVIDQEKCTRCGDCLPVCPTHAIQEGLMLGLNEQGKPGCTGLPYDLLIEMARAKAQFSGTKPAAGSGAGPASGGKTDGSLEK